MKLQFITFKHIEEAVKYLVSDSDGDHLPYTDDDGTPNHRLMGAAWAALHGGYRGNKYQGSNKSAAITKLKALYKSEKMDTPQESAVIAISGGVFFQEALAKDDSFDSVRCAVMNAVCANIKAGIDMDGDDDGAEDSGRCTNCGCVCGGSYGCNCCVDCECESPEYAWCQDIFPGTIVYSMDGKLMQCDYTIDDDGDVQLGDPEEVEMSYTPVAQTASESRRTLAIEATELKESAYDSSKGQLTVTVIKPGFSKNKTTMEESGKVLPRYYPAATLKRDHKIFNGAKMFADHQTAQEAKARPEGSVKDWVASLGETWAEADGTIMGTATVIDPQFKAKLDTLNSNNMLKEMKTSVRIGAAVNEGEAEGQEAAIVESIVFNKSVDFVTYAGAGGQVEAMESERDGADVDLISEKEFRKRRPDIVQLIESSAQGAKDTMKSLEQQLQEANTQLAAEKKRADEASAKLVESDKTMKKATATAELTKMLSESKLPEAAQKRIQKQFAEAVSVEGMKEAIESEKEYIKSLQPGSGVRNLGEKHNGIQESADDVKEANLQLIDGYKRAGLTEAEAKLAAGVSA